VYPDNSPKERRRWKRSNAYFAIRLTNALLLENGYTGRQCSECGLIYISPRPAPNDILNLYRDDRAFKPAEVHIQGELFKRLHSSHNLKILMRSVKGGNLLDIGAGAGYFLDEARKKGFHPYAIELNAIQADSIRDKLKLPCEDSPISNNTFGDTKFDVLYHCDVISHFSDPIASFKKMHEKMSDNSFIIFETGNLGEIDHKYLKLFNRFSYPDHLFFFSTDNLRDLLERTNFKLVKMYRYSLMPELIAGRIFKTLRGKKSKSDRQSAGQDNDNRSDKRKSDVHFTIASFNDSPLKRLIRNVFYYCAYLLRYKIGYVLAVKGQPQTVIVVAQKQKSGSTS